MSSRLIRRVLSVVLLGVAYIAAVLNWLWLMIAGLPRLIESGKIDLLTAAPQPTPEIVHTDAWASSPLIWLVVGVATLGILIMTVVVLIRLPRTIVETGQKVVDQTAEAILPALTHHKPLPEKKKKLLSRRLVLLIQLSLSLIPLLVCLFLPSYHELTRQIIVTLAAFLCLVSMVGFVLSWLIMPAVTSRTRSRASRG